MTDEKKPDAPIINLNDIFISCAPPPKRRASEYFYLDDTRALKNSEPKLYDALRLIEKYSPLGASLLHWAHDNNIGFRILSKHENYGTYGDRKININGGNTLTQIIATIPHEIMHAMMDIRWDRPKIPSSFDLRGRIIIDMAEESGAETTTAMTLHEMRINGYDGLNIVDLDRYSLLYRAYETAYDRSMRAGKTHEASQRTACAVAHGRYFSEKSITAGYLRAELVSYLRDITNKNIRQIPPNNRVLTGTMIRDLTQIGNDKHLIDEAPPLPNDHDIFGAQKRLRQAVDYAEYYRLRRVRTMRIKGVNSHDLLKAERALIEDENPFHAARVDLKEAYAEYRRLKDEDECDGIINILMARAGLDEVNQSFMKFDYDPPKVEAADISPPPPQITDRTPRPAPKATP